METMSAPTAPGQLAEPPLRVAFMFMPNGVRPSHWTPKGNGEDYEITPYLKPLEAFKDDFLLLETLWNKKSVGRNGHWPKVLDRMKKLDEGGTSLLDNSMVMFGLSIKDGNRHTEKDLPLVLAGRGKGSLRPGRRIRAPQDTPLCNLYLSMLHRLGIEADTFGDSTGELKGLS
jgi:hypothetical protein